MKSKIIVLDDTCKSRFGGTALTLTALCENLNDVEFLFIETAELNNDVFSKISKDSVWILGNVLNLNTESFRILNTIVMFRKFIKIEFDYGFCVYRCEQGFKHFTGMNTWEPWGEKGNPLLRGMYDLYRRFAAKTFYMSKAQMDIHNKMLDFSNVPTNKQAVLGSCFGVNHLVKMVAASQRKGHNGAYAIIDGNGGWHSQAKGVKEAVLHAKSNNLNFSIIKEKNYDVFLDVLSGFKGLIFLPQIHDACPRVTIEAKLMGLDLISNDNCQHSTEEWFSYKEEQLANYLLERPQFFRNETAGIL